MLVERIWTGNAYRNYNYLIACPESGEALTIDPLNHAECLAAAKARGWQITQILNTREHHDHTGGNAAVAAATGPKVIAHHLAAARISGVGRDEDRKFKRTFPSGMPPARRLNALVRSLGSAAAR